MTSDSTTSFRERTPGDDSRSRRRWRWVGALGLLTVALLAGWYVLRVVRHARYDLVTLHVRDRPLAEVVRALERQTREIIVAAGDPAATVSLDLDAAPLATALDHLAEQTGAIWRTTFAVYPSAPSLRNLVALLRSGKDPLEAGWTQLSARGDSPSGADGDGEFAGGVPSTGRPPDPGPGVNRSQGGPRRRIFVQSAPAEGPPGAETSDIRVVRGGPGPELETAPFPGGPAAGERVTIHGGTVVTDGDGGRMVRTFDLSPERLLLETSLLPRLGEVRETAPTVEAAARTAGRVQGRWSTVHQLESFPVPHLASEVRRLLRSTAADGGGLPSEGGPGIDDGAELEGRIRRHQYDRLTKMSPEQRARAQSERRRAGAEVVHEP